MIKYTDQESIKGRIFSTPFDNELDPKNRWVQLEKIIPWDAMAAVFMSRLNRFEGRGSIDLRVVMGAMFIQHSLNLTDRATIQMIQENIYMQYFIGLSSFQIKGIFDHSLLSIFRKRLGKKGSKSLVDIFMAYSIDSKAIKHRKARVSKENVDKREDEEKDQDTRLDVEATNDDQDSSTTQANKGTVKIDATVVPQYITYPTDTKLLNESREISEQIIDILYAHKPELWNTKQRTYRREARKRWLIFSKNRKHSTSKIRKQKKADLCYLRRNLRHIDEMMSRLIENGIQIKIKNDLRKKLYVISEVYGQQKEMYDNKAKQIADRIVSISQPWIRPIVRGKAGSPVEFGAKINISVTEKMITVDQSSYDSFNEGNYLKDQLESYKSRFGYYPEYALVDKIYMTRANRKYMDEKGIKHTGRPLGRPPKNKKKITAKLKKKTNERNHVEGKIGQAKQKYGLDKLRTKLKSTSFCAINLIVLAMNMITLQRKVIYTKLTNTALLVRNHIDHFTQYLFHQTAIIPLNSKLSNMKK